MILPEVRKHRLKLTVGVYPLRMHILLQFTDATDGLVTGARRMEEFWDEGEIRTRGIRIVDLHCQHILTGLQEGAKIGHREFGRQVGVVNVTTATSGRIIKPWRSPCDIRPRDLLPIKVSDEGVIVSQAQAQILHHRRILNREFPTRVDRNVTTITSHVIKHGAIIIIAIANA